MSFGRECVEGPRSGGARRKRPGWEGWPESPDSTDQDEVGVLTDPKPSRRGVCGWTRPHHLFDPCPGVYDAKADAKHRVAVSVQSTPQKQQQGVILLER